MTAASDPGLLRGAAGAAAWFAVTIVLAAMPAALHPARAADASAPAAGGGSGAAAQRGDEMILFEELPSVFGASKYEQKPSEAPASVTIVTAEEIERYGYRTLAEVLRSVRGFFTTNDRNYTYVAARGFGRTGDYNTRILLLLDGHRTNDNIFDATYFGTESIVDIDAIDRVEVIRGPASSLYGTNAFLAVVNVITKAGRDMKGTEVSLETESYATYRGRVAWGNRLANGAEAVVSGTWFDRGGQDLYFPEFDDPLTNSGMAEGVDGDRYRTGFARLSKGDWSLEAAYNHRRKQLPAAPYGVTFNDGASQTIDQRGFLNLAYDHALSPTSRVGATLAYDFARYDGSYMYAPTVLRDYGYGQWWSASGQATRTFADRHKVIAGGEYRWNARQDQGIYDQSPYFLYMKDRRSSGLWAVFVQDEYRVNEAFIINAGVRHDGYDTFGGTTNPRLALIFGPAGTTVKAMYGRAFRAPNSYELYYDDTSTQKGNPGLGPETIDTFEVAFEHAFTGGMRSVVSVFHYRIRDLIVQVEDPLDMLAVFRNIDSVKADGIELELEGRMARRLEGRISYTYQDSENEATGDTLVNSPAHLARLNLTAPLLGDKASAALEVQYASRRLTLAGERTRDAVLTNVTFLARPWKNGASITAAVFNVFGQDYADPAGEEHTQDAIPQDGRTFRVLFKFPF